MGADRIYVLDPIFSKRVAKPVDYSPRLRDQLYGSFCCIKTIPHSLGKPIRKAFIPALAKMVQHRLHHRNLAESKWWIGRLPEIASSKTRIAKQTKQC